MIQMKKMIKLSMILLLLVIPGIFAISDTSDYSPIKPGDLGMVSANLNFPKYECIVKFTDTHNRSFCANGTGIRVCENEDCWFITGTTQDTEINATIFTGIIEYETLASEIIKWNIALSANEPIIIKDEIIVPIEIRNRNASGREDVIIEYFLTLPNGEIVSRSETLAVETLTSIVRHFDIVESGDYLLEIELSNLDGNMMAVMAINFSVITDEKEDDLSVWEYLICVSLLISVLAAINSMRQNK